MKREELEKYTSELEMEIDHISYTLLKFKELYDELKMFQSKCDFNLFWLYNLAPEVILHIDSIKFLNLNIQVFKRKLTTKEMLKYDYLINYYKPSSFDEFKKLI